MSLQRWSLTPAAKDSERLRRFRSIKQFEVFKAAKVVNSTAGSTSNGLVNVQETARR